MSNVKVSLAGDLYRGNQEDIYTIPKDSLGTYVKTNSIGKLRIGYSQYRPANTVVPVKYGKQSKLLDGLLLSHNINAYEGPGVVYVEITQNNNTYHALCNESGIQWEEDAPFNSTGIIPFVLYALSGNSALTELKDAFVACLNDFNTTSAIQIQNMLLFNDSFYYGFAKNREVNVESRFPIIDQVKKAISSGQLKQMDILTNVNGIPPISLDNGRSLQSQPKTPNNDADLFAKAKAGKLIIPYTWDDKRKSKIPPLSVLDDYIPCEQFYSIVRKIRFRQERILARMDAGMTGVDAIGDDYVNIFLVGKPGTGKTTLVKNVGAALGMPVTTVSGTKNTDSDEFEGKTKVVNGALDTVNTEYLEAFENGGIIVIEEANLIDTNVLMGTTGQSIEYPFILMKNGYEAKIRHPMCVIIHTMNVGTEGARPINQAYSNRSKQTYVMNDTLAEDFINILMQKGYDRKTCQWAYKAYDKVVGYLKSPDISREELCLNIGVRSVIGCLQNIEEGDDLKTAFKNSVVGKIAEVDLELYEDIIKNVVNCLPDRV